MLDSASKGDTIKGLSLAALPFYLFLIFLFSPDTLYVEITGRYLSFFGTLTIIPLFYQNMPEYPPALLGG
jgi:hypothetical protein